MAPSSLAQWPDVLRSMPQPICAAALAIPVSVCLPVRRLPPPTLGKHHSLLHDARLPPCQFSGTVQHLRARARATNHMSTRVGQHACLVLYISKTTFGTHCPTAGIIGAAFQGENRGCPYHVSSKDSLAKLPKPSLLCPGSVLSCP